MDERTNIWKYCSREQSMEFLLSLRLTEDFRGAQDHRLAQLYEISNHPQRHYRKAVIPKKREETGCCGFQIQSLPSSSAGF